MSVYKRVVDVLRGYGNGELSERLKENLRTWFQLAKLSALFLSKDEF